MIDQPRRAASRWDSRRLPLHSPRTAKRQIPTPTARRRVSGVSGGAIPKVTVTILDDAPTPTVSVNASGERCVRTPHVLQLTTHTGWRAVTAVCRFGLC